MVDEMETRRKGEKQGASRLVWGLRLGIGFILVIVSVTAVLFIFGRGGEVPTGAVNTVTVNQSLNPVERLYLRNYLLEQADGLLQPAGSTTEVVKFVVTPGETANSIATNLAAANLLSDTELFLNYARYYGLDAQLEAGEFRIRPGLTIPELAVRLTQVLIEEVELGFLEGWRVEEIANYLAVIAPAQINSEQFLAIVQRRTAFDLTPYTFLASLPAESSLEGFLLPGSYVVPLEADAAYLVDLMLQRFGEQVTPAMRQSYGTQGLSLLEAVTLASIVEREAVVAAERPIIAGVFYNRLAQGMLLQADPTVQYAVGYDGTRDSWWKSPLSVADLETVSSYNTYQEAGLPPGPIANPSVGSLEAVANPTVTQYLFFVAGCGDTANTHRFGITYEEHLENIAQCQ